MIDYASTAQEILESDSPTSVLRLSPVWVRERIQESDKLRNQLEEINLREANQQAAVVLHNRKHPDDKRPLPEPGPVPTLLRLKVRHLANDELNLDCKVPLKAIPLLNLVYDQIQEELFNLGGYRRLRDPEEEEGWPS